MILFSLLTNKNIRNASLYFRNKMADIKEEKTRFDIFFLFFESLFFGVVEMKCVSFISLFISNALKQNFGV